MARIPCAVSVAAAISEDRVNCWVVFFSRLEEVSIDPKQLDVYSPAVEAKYQQALDGLAANTRYLLDFPQPC